jgi:hypothetical protein
VIVTVSLGSSSAKPKTSKPGPKFAEVAGALIIIPFGSDAPRFLPIDELMSTPPY